MLIPNLLQWAQKCFGKKLEASNYANFAFLDFTLFSPFFLLRTFLGKKGNSWMIGSVQDIPATPTPFQ
jgi:hypothetical protein